MALPSIQTCVPNLKRRTGNAGLDGDLPLNFNNPTLAPGLAALFPMFPRNISGSEEEKGRESGKEMPDKTTSSPNQTESKERQSKAAGVSSISSDDEKVEQERSPRRAQNKRYSKHDVSVKSGEENVPMLANCDDVESPKEKRTCEMATQTSLC